MAEEDSEPHSSMPSLVSSSEDEPMEKPPSSPDTSDSEDHPDCIRYITLRGKVEGKKKLAEGSGAHVRSVQNQTAVQGSMQALVAVRCA